MRLTGLGAVALGVFGLVQGHSVRQADGQAVSPLQGEEPVYDTVKMDDVAQGELEVPEHIVTAQENAPLGMTTITDAENAPVGALELPDDLPGEEVFTAASFEEDTFSESGVIQTVSTNFEGGSCPVGMGRPVNQPNAACRKPRGNVEGYTFIDDDNNLSKEAGEVGVPGVLLTISNKAATFRASVRTDSTGHYMIKNLPPGTYYITMDITSSPPGLTPAYDQVAIAVQPFTNLLQDFPFQGEAPPVIIDQGTIESYVFVDNNRNGAFDTSDTPTGSVAINIRLSTSTTVLQTVTSDERGLYSFTGLAGGTYVVSLDTTTIPANVTPRRSEFTVTLGNTQMFTDGLFPLTPPPPSAAIGPAYVFLDSNRNGIQDSGEKGLQGVVIKLQLTVSHVVSTAITDANGMFRFTELAAGNYIVQLDPTTLPATYESQRVEARNVLTLAQGQVETNANFPINAPAKGDVGISRVYSDFNNNGVQDSNEPGLANVLVSLVDSLGKTVASATTDSNGYFSFTDVPVGLYTVTVDSRSVPSRYTLDTPNPATVSIAEGATSPGITIRAAVKLGTVGQGTAFVDTNRNGVQDTNEAAVPDVNIMLISNGNVVQTVKTDSSGKYSFSNVNPGVYIIRVERATIPFGLATVNTNGEYQVTVQPSTTAAAPVVDIPFSRLTLSRIRGKVLNVETPIPNVKISVLDSAGKIISTVTTDANGEYSVANLAAGTYNLQVDEKSLPQGVVPADKKTGMVAATVRWNDSLSVNFLYMSTYGTIGPGTVFVDLNGNEIMDSNEPGVAGVTVDLLNTKGSVIQTAKTSSNGQYQFNTVAAGTYEVKVVDSTLPPEYSINRISYALRLKSGQQFTGSPANFPVVTSTTPTAPGAIQGFVFRDVNSDGVRNTGEAGVANVKVQLVVDGAVQNTATSDSSGRYAFTSLAPGSYNLQLDATTLSDGFTSSRPFSYVTVASGQTVESADTNFPVVASATGTAGIVGAVYGPSDVPISRVTVNLLNSSGTRIVSSRTGSNGQFIFPSLTAGTYTIVIDQTSLPSGLTPSYDYDGVLDHRTTVNLSSTPVTVIFRYQNSSTSASATIGPNYVFYDANQNGAKEDLEQGTANVKIELLQSDVVVQTAVTGESGSYTFSVAPGTYKVKIDTASLPSYTQAYRREATVTVAAGETSTSSNFPVLFIPGQLAGRIFIDRPNYYTLDSSDVGFQTSIVVHAVGDESKKYFDTTTDSDGNFVINNVAPGSYVIEVKSPSAPATMSVSPSGSTGGSNGAVAKYEVTVSPGAAVRDLNFGFMRPSN